MDRQLAARLLCVSIGGFFALQGVWAFVAPRSWFDALATFEPFNEHFVHDIGTFQMGIGVAAVVSAFRVKAIVAGLAGLATFQVLHVVSHVIDRDSGGRPGFDIPSLSILTILTVIALIFVWRSPETESGAE
ncbi:MAG: hypothetical protein QOH79_2487 [Acidimicrobiaceae bacterium]|jgi:hypothetical protein